MKGLIVLLCALAAVQARSTAVSTSPARTAADLGDNPWLLHLRIAVSMSGLLETCTGSLIHSSWALTATSCVDFSRYIWIRYATLNVINAELVTENSLSIFNPDADFALININRVVHFTDNIAPVALAAPGFKTSGSVTLCGFSEPEADVPGELLTCAEIEVESDESSIVSNVATSKFDIGAPLVKDGVQIGLLTGSADGESTFVRPGDYLEWIEEQTGVNFGSEVEAVVASADPTKVTFVN